MSILETVKKGHVLFGDGLFDIPSTKKFKIESNQIYFHIKKSFAQIQNIEN